MNADWLDWFAFFGGYTIIGFIGVVAFSVIERKLMGINESLASIKASLDEAASEIVTKIADLQAQVEASEPVDPALLAEVAAVAQGLADLVSDDEVTTEEAGAEVVEEATEEA